MLPLNLLLAPAFFVATGCAPALDSSAHAAAVGRVEVHVRGPAALLGEAGLCGGADADTGSSHSPNAGPVPLPGVAVWVEGAAPSAQRSATVRWTPCGPEPAAVVAATGTALSLENSGRFPMTLAWGDGEEAALAAGAVRRVEVPAGTLQVTAPGREQSAWILPDAAAAAGTDAKGLARLHQVPAGRARVHISHPLAPARVLEVEVDADGRAVVEVELTAGGGLSAVQPGGAAGR